LKKKTNSLAITILVAVLVGAAAFYGGMQFEKGKIGSVQAQLANGAGGGGQHGFSRFGGAGGGRNGGNRPVSGTIVSQDSNSITVKMQDGSTKIVNLTKTTMINKSSTATVSDLKSGEQVSVFGQANSDGSVNAMMVSLGGNMFFRGGPGGVRPSGQPAPIGQ
jgi:hypothetical protein